MARAVPSGTFLGRCFGSRLATQIFLLAEGMVARPEPQLARDDNPSRWRGVLHPSHSLVTSCTKRGPLCVNRGGGPPEESSLLFCRPARTPIPTPGTEHAYARGRSRSGRCLRAGTERKGDLPTNRRPPAPPVSARRRARASLDRGISVAHSLWIVISTGRNAIWGPPFHTNM